MQFTDIILKFLERLGYSEKSVILTTINDSLSTGDYEARESTAVLVLGRNDERVIGVFMLADESDRRSTVVQSAALQKYSKKFDRSVELYLVSHTSGTESLEGSIEFYRCERNGQSSQIDINDFPSYSEMWLMNTLETDSEQKDCENKRNTMLVSYAYFFSLVFLVLAVGDIFVEKMLDMSYLNTQRALLLVVSVLLLFVPSFAKKHCRS